MLPVTIYSGWIFHSSYIYETGHEKSLWRCEKKHRLNSNHWSFRDKTNGMLPSQHENVCQTFSRSTPESTATSMNTSMCIEHFNTQRSHKMHQCLQQLCKGARHFRESKRQQTLTSSHGRLASRWHSHSCGGYDILWRPCHKTINQSTISLTQPLSFCRSGLISPKT